MSAEPTSELRTTKRKSNQFAGGKCIMSSESLLKALRPLIPVINYSSVLPILECVHIKIESGPDAKMTLTVTDLEAVWYTTLYVEARQSFDFCVDARLLYKFCYNLPEQPIVLEYTENANLLTIKADGDMVVHMVAESPLNFPKLPAIDNIRYSWKCGHSVFVQPLGMAIKFLSNDDLRPAMTGVYLHEDNGKLMMVATDAHRLYWTAIADKCPLLMKECKIILPGKHSRLIVKNFKKGEDVVINATEDHFQLKSDSICCIIRKIDARYPDYSKVVPKPETEFYFLRAELKSFLKIAINFTNKSTHQLEMNVDKDRVVCKTGDVDFQYDLTYKLPIYNANKSDIQYSFGVNAKFMLEMVDLIRDEYVKLRTMETANQAMVFDDCILLMPLMLPM